VLSPPTYIVPSPVEAFHAFLANWYQYCIQAVITISTAAVGLLLGILLGLALVTAREMMDRAATTIEASAIIVRTVPVVAIAPIITVIFGTGYFSRVMVAALVSFFPIFSSVLAGINRVDREYLRLMDLYGATRFQRLVLVRFPTSIPYVLSSGLPSAATLSVLGALIAEFCGSDKGIGFHVLLSLYRSDTPALYANVVITAIIGIVFYFAGSVPEMLGGKYLHTGVSAEDSDAKRNSERDSNV
jgi:ABC-type nitrate/sulfonate/bicarbonate transport system permease component